MCEQYSISLLFNANKTYDRQVLTGIGDYLKDSRCRWDLFLQDDFSCDLQSLSQWAGDGIIADMDDPHIREFVSEMSLPVVGVGASCSDSLAYPDCPFVASDNVAVVELAYQHMKEKGIQNFAFYGVPPDPSRRWACEREQALRRFTKADNFWLSVFNGSDCDGQHWNQAQASLANWLRSLPIPCGILAVTDARARHLLQLCERLEILVPEQLVIVGIDDEEMTQALVKTPLTSVRQGCHAMGYQAAKLLHRKLHCGYLPLKQWLIPPEKISQRTSSDYKPVDDPYVQQAMHYIRHNAHRRVKVEQVQDFVGISRSNLERRFRSSLGHSIHTQLHTSRRKLAEELLIETELPYAEVAEIAGYRSVQYLYSVFKKDLGVTPTDFRANRRTPVAC